MKMLAFLALLLLIGAAVYLYHQPGTAPPTPASPSQSAAPSSPTASTPPAATIAPQPAPDPLAAALLAAQANAQKATDAHASLVASIKDRIKATAEYQAAMKLEEDVKLARVNNSPDLPAISSKWIDAKTDLAKAEAALMSSPEMKAAKEELAKATAALGAARAAIANRVQQAPVSSPDSSSPPAKSSSIFSAPVSHGK